MAILDLGIVMIGLLVGFGLVIGILFGFFGMGGSFLVTPALLVAGYPATVAVGSGLAFVFGTSVIGALRHHDHDQICYELAAVMIPGMTVGIEVGKRIVFLLEDLSSADFAISVGYVGLLGAVGIFALWDARTDDTYTRPIEIGAGVGPIEFLPSLALPGGASVSVWSILVISFGIGIISGCLGVGGGFLLLPMLIYGFGVPAGIAVGTSIVQILVSSAYGTFVYALSNAVNVPVVAALLSGSAFGARIGTGATQLVHEADSKGYFAAMLLAGSIATASKQLGVTYGIEALGIVSAVLIFGTACLVSGAIICASIVTLAENREHSPPLTH